MLCWKGEQFISTLLHLFPAVGQKMGCIALVQMWGLGSLILPKQPAPAPQLMQLSHRILPPSRPQHSPSQSLPQNFPASFGLSPSLLTCAHWDCSWLHWHMATKTAAWLHCMPCCLLRQPLSTLDCWRANSSSAGNVDVHITILHFSVSLGKSPFLQPARDYPRITRKKRPGGCPTLFNAKSVLQSHASDTVGLIEAIVQIVFSQGA